MENEIVIVGGITKLSLSSLVQMSDNDFYKVKINFIAQAKIDKIGEISSYSKFEYMKATKKVLRKLLSQKNYEEIAKIINQSNILEFENYSLH